VEKYGTASQTTDGSIIQSMHFSFWITNATDTHSDLVITYCISTAIMITRTNLAVSFTRTLPVLT